MTRAARSRSRWGALLAVAGAAGCAAPPASTLPDAASAIARMRGSQACSAAVVAEAKLDYFGEEGRIRGSADWVVALPARVRIDVFSPFGALMSTLTSDGETFMLFDVTGDTVFEGPANACNLDRFAGVPVPPHALVALLRGEAPLLAHEPGDASLVWRRGRGGYYRVTIAGQDDAVQTVDLAVHPDDRALPWAEQRLRVQQIEVRQRGELLYRARLSEHAPAPTAAPSEDPSGFGPAIPPSGPECDAELPRRVRFEAPVLGRDLVLVSDEVEHNPPLTVDTFHQERAPGVSVRPSPCPE